MNKGVGPIQESKSILMPMHEPLLNTPFLHREQKAQPAELLKLQNGNAVPLGYIPYTRLRENALRSNGGHAVESVINDPVKHFDQERKLLKEATVEVVLESRGVWSVYRRTTAPSGLGQSLIGINRILGVILVLWIVRG
jgi:hypothetical protein